MLGFPTLIALHSVGMAVVVGLSLIVSLRLSGLIPEIGERHLPRLLDVAVWGFALNLVTGLLLFITRGSEYIVSYTYDIKMLLVIGGATILFWLRGRLGAGKCVTGSSTDALARSLSLVATVLWFGAVVAGRLIAYLSDIYR